MCRGGWQIGLGWIPIHKARIDCRTPKLPEGAEGVGGDGEGGGEGRRRGKEDKKWGQGAHCTGWGSGVCLEIIVSLTELVALPTIYQDNFFMINRVNKVYPHQYPSRRLSLCSSLDLDRLKCTNATTCLAALDLIFAVSSLNRLLLN